MTTYRRGSRTVRVVTRSLAPGHRVLTGAAWDAEVRPARDKLGAAVRTIESVQRLPLDTWTIRFTDGTGSEQRGRAHWHRVETEPSPPANGHTLRGGWLDELASLHDHRSVHHRGDQ